MSLWLVLLQPGLAPGAGMRAMPYPLPRVVASCTSESAALAACRLLGGTGIVVMHDPRDWWRS